MWRCRLTKFKTVSFKNLAGDIFSLMYKYISLPCRYKTTRLNKHNQTRKPCPSEIELKYQYANVLCWLMSAVLLGSHESRAGRRLATEERKNVFSDPTRRQHTTADLKFPSEARLLRVSIVCVHASHKNTFSLLQSCLFFFNRVTEEIASSQRWRAVMYGHGFL